MYGTTPMKLLRRQSLQRKIAYKKAQALSWEHDKRQGNIKLMHLISLYATVALITYPAITT